GPHRDALPRRPRQGLRQRVGVLPAVDPRRERAAGGGGRAHLRRQGPERDLERRVAPRGVRRPGGSEVTPRQPAFAAGLVRAPTALAPDPRRTLFWRSSDAAPVRRCIRPALADGVAGPGGQLRRQGGPDPAPELAQGTLPQAPRRP